MRRSADPVRAKARTHTPLAAAMVIALLLCLAFASPASAQAMLKAELTPLIVRLKVDAPTPALVEFTYAGVSLLEGTLELRLRDEGGEHLLTTRTPDLALAAGSQTFRITLPPIPRHSGGFVHADMLFRTQSGAYLLGTRQLMVSDPMTRALSLGIVQGNERADDQRLNTIRALRFERFDPDKDSDERRPAGRLISTGQSYLPAEEAPVAPLGYCSYDLLCVTERGFSLLRERQLDALLVWVKAGGCLCLFPGADVKQYHLEFLNKLAGEERFELDAQGDVVDKGAAALAKEAPPPSADVIARSPGEDGTTKQSLGADQANKSSDVLADSPSEGLLRRDAPPLDNCSGPRAASSGRNDVEEGGAPLLRRVELGRAVVALAPVPDEDWPGWRRAAAFLWKARKAQMDGMAGRNEWDPNQCNIGANDEYRYRYGAYAQNNGTPGQEKKLISAAPISLAASGELTGTLAPREVRVIPFWLVGLLLAAFLGLIGPGDYFILGRLGKRKYTWVTLPVYCVAFTALFVGLSRHYIGSRDHRRSLIIQDEDADGNVLRASRIEMVFTAGSRRVITPVANALAVPISAQPYYYRNETGTLQPPDYTGRFPASYQLEQQMEQWTYRVYRYLSMEPKHTGRKINWRATAPDAPNIVSALTANSGGFGVTRFHAAEASSPGGTPFLHENVLKEFSVHPQMNFFSLVSQLSPSGTSALEDLALLDPSDESQWLLAVVEQQGEDIIVHRHLYCTEVAVNK